MWKVARKEQGKIYDYSMEGFLYLLNGGYDFKFHFTNPLIWKKKLKGFIKKKEKRWGTQKYKKGYEYNRNFLKNKNRR